MNLEGKGHQMSMKMELTMGTSGETACAYRSDEEPTAVKGDGRSGTDHLMEEVVERNNLKEALKRVKKNKGSPGIDGMTTEDLPSYLVTHWPRIRAELLAGTYQPKPVRRQIIPKSDGGARELGIPCVLDRFL